MRKKLLTQSFLAALGEGVYILLVALFMRNADKVFGNNPSVLGIIAFLLLLVISAAVSGALVLGKPVLAYFDGRKKEAFELFALTVAWLVVFLIILFIAFAVGV